MLFALSQNSLLFPTAASNDQSFVCFLQVKQGLRIFIAGKLPALKVEQLPYQQIYDIFDAAAVNSNVLRGAVLKNNVDKFIVQMCVAAIHASELFHVFAHKLFLFLNFDFRSNHTGAFMFCREMHPALAADGPFEYMTIIGGIELPAESGGRHLGPALELRALLS
jgi:hypothetical protein